MTLSQKLWVPFEPDGEPPIIRAVDEILDSAVASRASDVHIEPFAHGGRVRERVDGVLRESRRLAQDAFERISSRLKLLAGMDIADRRVPQEGRYYTRAGGRWVEARVSSMPTVAGERLAIRLLEPESAIGRLEELGMPALFARRYRALVHAPAGFVVVCGPTGSGKTTTLYASLAERNVVGQHICSVEDPVEVRLPGVAQVQVNVRAGVTFAVALRAFLRQDPNVIMIGEMRDTETATVAASAALCGQLVLTTLHGNDSLHALERLAELGVAERTIAAAVSGVVSQRLLRQLCTYCKSPETPSAAIGCERCGGTGYWGRSAVFETIEMTDRLREAIERKAPLAVRRAIALEQGYEPMRGAVARLVESGETSVEEAERVLGAALS
ncbi:MAG: type II/IV secretion system protein [Candidatus Eremiobacteraeota bacterium]|nr:type II/IV secretion system protein [Candidatus Eremiobacteraeota bacterium]MBV8722467.1 type II/IV secretion system protein [Candidatus Eremiobacteraeota bacterium]